MGNTTLVYNLFQIAGRDLPKRLKSGWALATPAAEPCKLAHAPSLAALKDQPELPALKDISPQKVPVASPRKLSKPALEDKQQTQLTRGPDGVYRLVAQGGLAGNPDTTTSPGKQEAAPGLKSLKASEAAVPETPRKKATGATGSPSAAALTVPSSPEAAAAGRKPSLTPSPSRRSRGRSRSRSSRRTPSPGHSPSVAATSVYASSEDESQKRKKDNPASVSSSPVRRRRRRSGKIILSPAQKNLRRLRGHRSLS